VRSSKPTRRDIKFLLAEDIRSEGPTKFSLLGLFPGERFVVGGTPPINSPNIAFMVPSLAFIFMISGSEGQFPGRFKLTAPDGKTIISEAQLETIVLKAGRSSVVANTSKPFVGPAFGEYTVVFDVGGAKFKFPVTIDKESETKPKAAGRVRKSQ
jgi:hypothetical protein